MKINTTAKTVVLSHGENLKEVTDYMQKNVPDWEQYTVEVETPIIINPSPVYIPYPTYPVFPVGTPCPDPTYNPPYKVICKTDG